MQELLWRGEAVLRAGHKDNLAYLFLPDKNGEYRVWKTDADLCGRSRLAADKRAYALIDPPESGPCRDAAACHIVKFASDNAKKHHENHNKESHLLVLALPTVKEARVIVPTLWNDKTPFPHQVADNADRFDTPEAKLEEMNLRFELAGTVLRAVFNHKNFAVHLNKVVTAAVEDSCEMDVRRFRRMSGAR